MAKLCSTKPLDQYDWADNLALTLLGDAFLFIPISEKREIIAGAAARPLPTSHHQLRQRGGWPMMCIPMTLGIAVVVVATLVGASLTAVWLAFTIDRGGRK
jgi:hypothetical protein